ncbi:MAG: glucose sorbosone dehydrogenase [Deltaproteobacteria bacterium]|nr:MAG: glucose sorbosone dehydrogenase [Deltaproteobacteria bacterium]
MDGMPQVAVELVADGFTRPVLALGHPTEPDRLFVVEQPGTIKILEPGQTTAPQENFLDIRSAVDDGPNEAGLLGLAFHPDFPQDPRFYVNYTVDQGPLRTRIAEFSLDPNDPDKADPNSERVVIEIDQPAGNHNGGMIAFGPDGYLYIGMGDGGGACDSAADSSRDPGVLLAKMLRIGVEPDGTQDNPVACQSCDAFGPFDYTIPPDNPFVGMAGYAPEIFALGLRNPWRFAFDPVTGLLYAGDVGQNTAEEIDLVEAGRDYGWVRMEGNVCSSTTNCGGPACAPPAPPNQENADGFTSPLVSLLQNDTGGCAVTGGAVYRSCEVPAWDGVYFYSDFCSRRVRGLVYDGGTVTDLGDLGVAVPGNVSGNGWNAWGDVFFTGFDGGGPQGSVYRLVPAP